jgi:hypothetical protein
MNAVVNVAGLPPVLYNPWWPSADGLLLKNAWSI